MHSGSICVHAFMCCNCMRVGARQLNARAAKGLRHRDTLVFGEELRPGFRCIQGGVRCGNALMARPCTTDAQHVPAPHKPRPDAAHSIRQHANLSTCQHTTHAALSMCQYFARHSKYPLWSPDVAAGGSAPAFWVSHTTDGQPLSTPGFTHHQWTGPQHANDCLPLNTPSMDRPLAHAPPAPRSCAPRCTAPSVRPHYTAAPPQQTCPRPADAAHAHGGASEQGHTFWPPQAPPEFEGLLLGRGRGGPQEWAPVAAQAVRRGSRGRCSASARLRAAQRSTQAPHAVVHGHARPER